MSCIRRLGQLGTAGYDPIRAIPSPSNDDVVEVLSGSEWRIYHYDSSETGSDNGDTILEPDDLTAGAWTLHKTINEGALVLTNPPTGHHLVTNLYVNQSTGNLVVEYDDASSGGNDTITSAPTTGNYRVTNVYVNQSNGRLVVEYDNTPA